MKAWRDDVSDWRLRQENLAEPFPYVYPQMPPRFRRCRAFAGGLFLLEWGAVLTLVLGGAAGGGVMLLRGEAALLEGWAAVCMVLVFFAALPLYFLSRLLRNTPKFFWRCPCCGLSFPYYAPPLRGLDTLKEADCVHMMEHLRVRYVKEKFCPLILPSACPECGAKFFDLPDGFSTGGR